MKGGKIYVCKKYLPSIVKSSYNMYKEIKLEKQEYAQIAHIINSKHMKKGRNLVFSDTFIYKVYWIKYDEWIIYGKRSIVERDEINVIRN